MASKKVVKKSSKKPSVNNKVDNRSYAFITVFFTIIGFIIALIAWRDDKYVMFYAKQSLVLFVMFVVASFVSWIPFIGPIISIFAYLAVVIFWVLAWVNALSGEERETPLVSNFTDSFDL